MTQRQRALRGARLVDVGPASIDDDEPAYNAITGVDAAGAVLGLVDGRVVRFTRRGGWRALY